MDTRALEKWRFPSTAVSLVAALVIGACAPSVQPAPPTGEATPAASPEKPAEAYPSKIPTATAARGTLRVATANPPITFDPHRSQAQFQLPFLIPAYDALLRRNPNKTFSPGLAASWKYLDVGETKLELKLRQGVKFHDGADFNAEVVKWNLERSKAAKGPRASTLSMLSSVDIVDASTVVLNLKPATPAVLAALAEPVAMMVSPNAKDDALKGVPQGTSPYTMDARASTGDIVVFRISRGYWDPSVQGVETIEVVTISDVDARLNALRTKQVHYGTIVPPQAKDAEAAGLKITINPSRWNGLLLADRDGALVPELKDVRVRRALNYAIDRKAIVEATQFGYATPTVQIFQPGSFASDPALEAAYPYDPAKAKQLLAEAGVSNLAIPTTALAQQLPWVEAVDGYLRAVGVSLKIEVAEPGTLGAKARSRQWPTVAFAYGQADPSFDVGEQLLPDGIYNPFKTQSARINELAAAGLASSDQDERAKIYRDISRIVVEDAWFVVAFYDLVVLANTDDVVGLTPYLDWPMPPIWGLTVR